MIEKKEKNINLKEIAPANLQNFSLESLYGRDLIAAQIEQDIDDYCLQTMLDGPRKHLGASVIGHNCERFLWFHFRWMKFEKHDARMARLFTRGHLEETRMIEMLRGIGFNVKEVEVDGKQIRVVDLEKHFGGSSDGEAFLPERYNNIKEKVLLEFKTSNTKNFTDIYGLGVFKAKPKHFIQASIYGYKLGIHYVLYMCVNKNDDALDIEVLQLDWDLAQAHINKAFVIINSQTPPKRLSDDPSYWECKFCHCHGICHLNQPLDKNCRSCSFAVPEADGQWKCNNWNAIIPAEAIANGCDAWNGLPR
jgi:hypothetical protein